MPDSAGSCARSTTRSPVTESQALARSLKRGRLSYEPAHAVTRRLHPSDYVPATPSRERKRPTWWSGAKRVALGAAILAAGFALASPFDNDRSAPVAGRLMLAEFRNHTRDSLLGVAVTEAVRAELSKIAQVDLAGARQVERWNPSDPVHQGEVLVLVTGDVIALGPGFTVSARLVTADSGRLLAVVQEDAADANLLLPTVKRLSQRLRGNVLQSLVRR